MPINEPEYRELLMHNLLELVPEDKSITALEAATISDLSQQDIDVEAPDQKTIRTAMEIARRLTKLTHHWPMLYNMPNRSVAVDYRFRDGRYGGMTIFVRAHGHHHACWSQTGARVGSPDTNLNFQEVDHLVASEWIRQTMKQWEHLPCKGKIRHHYPEHYDRIIALLDQALTASDVAEFNIRTDYEAGQIKMNAPIPGLTTEHPDILETTLTIRGDTLLNDCRVYREHYDASKRQELVGRWDDMTDTQFAITLSQGMTSVWLPFRHSPPEAGQE